jgi:hypothetical protein
MFAKKRHFRIFALIMPAILAFLMTGVITFINTRLDTGYLLHRGRAFVFAWPIALTVVLLFGPHVRTIAEQLCTRDG